MPSEEEQQPGPSGVSREELLFLLGLNVSDSEDDEEEAVEEEDLWCNQAMDNFDRQRAFQSQLLEQSGGGIDPETPIGTFEFDLQPYVNRTSDRMGVHERHFTTRLRQTGNFVDTPHVAQALRNGLQRAMARVLNSIPDLHDDDRLYFNIISNRLSRGDFNGWGVRVREWREGGDRTDAVLNRLSRALNTNGQFETDDSFQFSITQVHHAPRGSGRKRQLKPGHQTLDLLRSKKQSIVQIQNADDLCCAHALVTAKVKVDQHCQWESIRKGRNLQKEHALQLHREAHVPLGPCGYEEFSKAPSLVEYQFLLVDADRAFHIKSFGPPDPDKQLILLHEKGHYDVITSLPGFLGRSYVCCHCFKPYNNKGRHRCKFVIKCLKNSRARPKSSKPTRSFETPKPTISSPSQTTNVTSWCTTRESLILSLSKPVPTDFKPDAKPVLSVVGHHASRPVKRPRKRIASHLEKSHLRGCPPHRQKRARFVVVQRPVKTASSPDTQRSTHHHASRSNLPAILCYL